MSPGFIIEMFDGSVWLTKELKVTWKWEKRGIWDTRKEAEAALAKSLGDGSVNEEQKHDEKQTDHSPQNRSQRA